MVTLEICIVFLEDRYRKTDKSSAFFVYFYGKKKGSCKSLDHQEKDKLQILTEIVYNMKCTSSYICQLAKTF